ncbi:MAG TPA: twin-arginine translocase subunit TatC [Candidatus Dormibacteraeota bacterium]
MAAPTMADDERRMTVVEHLEELRGVLMWSLGSWLVATFVLFLLLHNQLVAFLTRPINTALATCHNCSQKPILTGVVDPLSVPLKLSAIAGFIAALPVIIWKVWTFVSPGLRPVERKFAAPFIASSLLLFSAGAAFAYLVMPLGLGFIFGFLGDNVQVLPDLNSYLGFFAILIAVFGLTFELPVVLVLLGVLGIISSRWLRKHRRNAIIVIIGTSILITPGADPFTPTALAIPLVIFYEASILILDKGFKR